MSRPRVRALVRRQGDGRGIAVPLAHRPAARVQERDWEEFTRDPTQLANGLRDLADAVGPDGLAVCLPEVLLADGPDLAAAEQLAAALEATARLRAGCGDRLALVACLPGPGLVSGGGAQVLSTATAFLGAGADVVVVLGGQGDPLATLANVARFHQALALGDEGHGLPVVATAPLSAPQPTGGVVLTDGPLPADTDFADLEDWVDAVRR